MLFVGRGFLGSRLVGLGFERMDLFVNVVVDCVGLFGFVEDD